MSEEKVTKHPSFGQISISRRHGGDKHLFGSPLEHHQVISLRIHSAEEHWDLHRATVYGNPLPLIEVEMSEAQFARLITTPNTSGVPCTLRSLKGEQIPPYVPTETVHDRFQGDIKEKCGSLIDAMKSACEASRELKAKKTITKKDVEALTGVLERVRTELESNIPFIEESFHEQVQNSLQDALLEFEAQTEHLIREKGLEAVKDQLPTLRSATDDPT